jgi:hypothetical protein
VYCEKHACYWFLDLHDSDSSRQWEQASKSLAAKLATMTEVKPIYFPEPEQMRAARNCRRRLIAELGQRLTDDQQEIVIRQLCDMTGMVVEGDGLRYRYEVNPLF